MDAGNGSGDAKLDNTPTQMDSDSGAQVLTRFSLSTFSMFSLRKRNTVKKNEN